LSALIELVGEQIRKVFKVSTAYVALYDAQKRLITFPYWKEGDLRHDMPPMPLGEGLTSRIIEGRQPLLVTQDAAKATQELGGVLTDDRPVQSYMGVPLTVGENVLGVLSVQTDERAGAFSESDVRLLTTIASNVSVAVQNARLFARTQQQVAELGTINTLSQALTTQRDVQALIDLVGTKVTEIFHLDALVALYDRNTQMISVPYFIGDDGTRLTIDSFPFGRGYSSYVIHTKKALVINQESDREQLGEFAPVQAGAVALSWLGVPILSGDEVLGVIAVQSSHHHNLFSENDARLLSTIAANTGVSLQNARLFEQAQKRAQELGVLNDLGRVVAGELDRDNILRALTERIRQLIALDAFSVGLYRPETETFFFAVFYEGGEYQPAEEGPIASFKHSAQVIQTRQPLLVLRAAEELEAEKARRAGSRFPASGSLMFAPLLVGAKALGVISVQSYALDSYTPDQLALLEGAAGQTAIALENARLFSEAQRRAEQLATAAEVSRASISVLNLDELAVQVVERIRERFDLYYAALFLIDDAQRWAVLRHATGDAGRTLLERKHKLEVGSNSMVGWATAHRKARIALDVGAEAVRFVNPLLPNTRSEMALPLVVGEDVLGALDVQSTQPNAFSEADVAILQTMADQIAIAIRNAQLITATQRTEQFLDSVIENLPITLYVKDSKDMRYIRWNKAGEELLGLTREDVLGKTDAQIFMADDAKRFTAQDRAVLASQRPMDIPEEQWQTQQGTRVVHSRRIPLLNDAGQVQYLLGLSDDITERKKAEAALDYERYLLRTMLDNVPDKIYFKDDKSRFIRVSRAVAEQFGLMPDQVVNKSDFDFFTREHAQQAFDDEQKMLQSGETVLGKLERETWPDRPDTWVLTSKMILRDPVGRVMGSFGISRDVTELKLAQDVAQRRAQQLAAAAEIAKAATSTLNITELLSQSVELIRDRFGFYHASIFIVEPGANVATLRASTGEAGRQLLARKHHLAVGSKSLVGTATATRDQVVVQDVFLDPHHLPNPLLPDTRAEAVIPLLAGDTVIGAMDAQSTQANAFSPDDLAILRTIADQLAVAVQNARLFDRTARQARREKLVVDITSKIRASNSVEAMLQTAVTELRDALGVSHGVVRLDVRQRATPVVEKPSNGEKPL
jgi:PAS domain S-box-containing protein